MPAPTAHLMDVSMFWGPCGGVRRVLSTKHSWLLRHGWRHTIMAPGAEGPDHVDCGGLALPFSGGYRFVWQRAQAQRLIEQARPDLLESADPYTLPWAVLAAAGRLGVPAVAFCHSDLPACAAQLPGGAFAERRAQAYLARLYGRFDLVLAPSRGLADKLRSWGLPGVEHQPLGVDCNVFTPKARNPAWRRQLCAELGLPPAARLLVYSGRFAPEKNLQVLADAVQRLGPGHVLLAIGSGPCAPRGDRVQLLPPEDNPRRLARLLASCDVYVHAGDQETFGLGVLEAMACGTPVVVSAAAGLGELVADVGLRVDTLQAETWAEALRAALATGRSVQSDQAVLRARAHDWNRVLAQLTARYRRLLPGSRGAGQSVLQGAAHLPAAPAPAPAHTSGLSSPAR